MKEAPPDLAIRRGSSHPEVAMRFGAWPQQDTPPPEITLHPVPGSKKYDV